MTARLFVFGLGYTGLAAARRMLGAGWQVAGTCRTEEKAARLRQDGVHAHVFPGDAPMADATGALAGTTHLLASIAPGADGDPALLHHSADIRAVGSGLKRIIYLSTTAVYGDQAGAWIDETTPVNPMSERAHRRVAAETAWQALAADLDVECDILRLSGIYGPGRSPFERLRAGTARRIVKPGQVFNRIHVDDIAQTVEALIGSDRPGAIYNLADNEPAPPQDVIEHAAGLIGLPVPPAVDFETADMSPMARSFYSESKRIDNRRIKDALGVQLAYPTYREGLAAIAAA